MAGDGLGSVLPAWMVEEEENGRWWSWVASQGALRMSGLGTGGLEDRAMDRVTPEVLLSPPDLIKQIPTT